MTRLGLSLSHDPHFQLFLVAQRIQLVDFLVKNASTDSRCSEVV